MAQNARNPEVIDLLNDVIYAELTAINQYILHAAINERFGYVKLAGALMKQSKEEMHHMDECLDRILYLNGKPEITKFGKIEVFMDVPDQLKADLDLEVKAAIPRLEEGIKLCTKLGDTGTRELLEEILGEEEGHALYLMQQLDQISQFGLQNYLQAQL